MIEPQANPELEKVEPGWTDRMLNGITGAAEWTWETVQGDFNEDQTYGHHALAGPAGADWPQFRGLQRDGASSEKGLMGSWPDGGPKEVFRVPIGDGYSGIAVVGDRLYTMYASEPEGDDKGNEFAAAFDAKTGVEIWRTAIGERFDNTFGGGPRATPTVDGGEVYVMSSFGDFASLDARDGTVRWKLSLTEVFGTEQPMFGFSSSCLVDGNRVILEAGGPEGKSYASLDRKNGEVQWTTGEAKQIGYSSPLVVEIGGIHQYVTVLPGRLRAVDADGKEVWSHSLGEGSAIAMPIFIAPDKIFASGPEALGAHLLQVETEEGRASVQELWMNAFMRNHFSSSVVDGDYLYGFDNAPL